MKKFRFRLPGFVLIATCALFAVVLSGCELLELFAESEQAQVKSESEEWMEVHGLNPVNEDGSVNTDATAKLAGRLFTDSTGDPEVDAALGSDGALAKIKEADRLDEKAWQMRDLAYLNQAIKLRPEDWKYRISRATLNIDMYYTPRWDHVNADFDLAEQLVGTQKEERIAYAEYGIERMEKLKTRLASKFDPAQSADLWKQPRVCQAVFSRLAYYYNVLADQTGRSDYRELAEQNTRDLGKCPPEK